MSQTFLVDSFKGIDNVEIKASHGDLVIIAGRNGAGKSSFIDGITELFDSKGVRVTPKPIKDGEKKAVAQFVDDELGVKVTRTWTKDDGGKLEVHSLDGAKYGKPAEVLAGLTGGLIFDPVRFLHLDEKKQRDELLAKVDLPFDLEALDREKAGAEGRRLDAGREVKRLTGAKSSLVQPAPGTPTEEVSAGDVLAEIRDAENLVRERESLTSKATYYAQEIAGFEAQIVALRERIERTQAEAARGEFELSVLAEPADLEALTAKLDGIEDTNAAVRAAKQYNATVAELKAAEALVDAENEKLASIDQQKRDGLAKAVWPDEGLGIDEQGVTLDGVPLKQANTARKIVAALRIATSGDPKVKLVIISDGDMLDADSIELVRSVAAEKGYTVLVERDRDESREVGFEIVEGRLSV